MGNGYYTASLGGKQIRVAAKYVLIAIAVVFFAAGFVAGVLVKTHVIPTVGHIIIVTPPPPSELKLNVYQDETCSVVLKEIDWGSMEPGESNSYTVWMKNLGDVSFTLSLSTDKWNPAEAATYITLSWDYANQTVYVGEVLSMVFTLEVSSSISNIDAFSFDIVITATEVPLGPI